MSLPAIVLRPAPGHAATIERLRAAGVETVHHVPLSALYPVAWTPPAIAAHHRLLLTSANAVRLAGDGLAALAALDCWCVGEATATAARAAGLRVSHVGDSDAAALIGHCGGAHWLWLAGRVHQPLRVEAPAMLTITCCYDSRPVAVEEEDADLLHAPGVILVHSAATAQQLATLVYERAPVHVVAISAAVAEALGSGWASVSIAAAPRDAEMVALAAKLCQESGYDS